MLPVCLQRLGVADVVRDGGHPGDAGKLALVGLDLVLDGGLGVVQGVAKYQRELSDGYTPYQLSP